MGQPGPARLKSAGVVRETAGGTREHSSQMMNSREEVFELGTPMASVRTINDVAVIAPAVEPTPVITWTRVSNKG